MLHTRSLSFKPHNRSRHAYTFVELMVSLTIFAFVSSAMSSLMFAAYNTNRHVRGTSDATSAAETAIRRIIEVTRSAADLMYTDPQTGLLVQTPPDSNNLSYIFIYYISGSQLHEKIETAGSLTLIQDTVIVDSLQSFSVTQLNPGQTPKCYEVDLILTATPVPITRSVAITARNLTH